MDGFGHYVSVLRGMRTNPETAIYTYWGSSWATIGLLHGVAIVEKANSR